MPFNWKTPFGYLMCTCLETVSMFSSAVLFVTILTLTIGFCILADAFVSDLEENLRELQEDLLITEKMRTKNEIAIKKKVIDFIQFHSEARE